MKKIFRGIVLFFGIVYVFCSCGVQHTENSAAAGDFFFVIPYKELMENKRYAEKRKL